MLHELDAAKALLHYSPTLIQLRRDQPERHLRLAELVIGILAEFQPRVRLCIFQGGTSWGSREQYIERCWWFKTCECVVIDQPVAKVATSRGEISQRRALSRRIPCTTRAFFCSKRGTLHSPLWEQIISRMCIIFPWRQSDRHRLVWWICGDLVLGNGKLHEDPLHQGAKNLMVHNDSVALNFSGKGDMIVARIKGC